MRLVGKCLGALFILINLSLIAYADSGHELRVGVFPMKPLNYIDEEGTAQGLYPDLLREIVHEENLGLVFVPGSWGECYDRLLKGEIDLLTTVAYSEERAKLLDYNQEAVADIWGKVYTRPTSGISGINDLTGRSVALARKDINGKNFLKTAKKFNIKPTIIEVESHYEIFSRIKEGRVTAGVVPQHFGFREAANFNLVPTTIEFEPFSVFFATKKDTNSHILKHIDQHLTNWKRNSDSIYYERVAYWMGGSELERKVIPQWIYLVILSIVIGAIILVLINASLKHQVKLRTQELSLREARFRTLSETTKAVPWELDIASGNFTYIGPRIVDVYGYPIEEWRNLQDLADKIHPEDRQEAMDFCHAETKQGRDHDFVYRGIHKDGREIWIHDIVTVSMGAKGPEKLYGYFVDITEIREHAQRFQKMFREHTAVMLLIDPESGSVVDANSAACRFYGYTREELISLPITRLNTLSAEEIREATRQALQAERNYFEFTHRLANGELRNIEAYSSPIVINKKPLLFAIVHDTTERKKLLEEHGRAAQLVALGTVAAGVAHEINNPINGIINYAQLLSSKPDESKRVSALSERISIEAERIAKITSDLLHYSKDNREEMKACDTRELIEGALSLIVPKIRPSGIKVKNTLADDAPGLMANPQGLQQIVINLVDNAYDALREKAATTEDKTIQVRSYLINVNGQPMFCLEVKDNGTGMDEKVKTKAKDAFFSTKPSTEGTGLGLSIVNDIVNRHNGSFEIDSKQGEYTRIQILLPMTKG